MHSNVPIHVHCINLLLTRRKPEKQSQGSCCPHHCIGNSAAAKEQGGTQAGYVDQRHEISWLAHLRKKLSKYENCINEAGLRTKKSATHNLISWIPLPEPTATGSPWCKLINKMVCFHWESRMQLRTTVTSPYDENSSNTHEDNSAQRAYHFQRGGDFQLNRCRERERENAPQKQTMMPYWSLSPRFPACHQLLNHSQI